MHTASKIRTARRNNSNSSGSAIKFNECYCKFVHRIGIESCHGDTDEYGIESCHGDRDEYQSEPRQTKPFYGGSNIERDTNSEQDRSNLLSSPVSRFTAKTSALECDPLGRHFSSVFNEIRSFETWVSEIGEFRKANWAECRFAAPFQWKYYHWGMCLTFVVVVGFEGVRVLP